MVYMYLSSIYLWKVTLTDNNIIEQELGKYGIVCIEDMVHQIYNVGPHFKEVIRLMWPFELNKPVGGLTGSKTLFKDGGDSGNREDLINEFFEITRFNLSAIELQYGAADLSRLLEQLTFEFQPMLREKNLTCALSTPETFPIRCDANKLQRVFDNLLRNAVLYCYPGTEITVTAERVGNFAVVRFRNRGDTIPPEKLSRIFEQFYRLDTARSSTGGAGLGLAIARQITQLHGGSLTGESRDDTVTFTVTLPIEKSAVGKS